MNNTLTHTQAFFIYYLRTQGYTWRKIAELYATATNSNDRTQQRGRELCEQAMKILGLE